MRTLLLLLGILLWCSVSMLAQEAERSRLSPTIQTLEKKADQPTENTSERARLQAFKSKRIEASTPTETILPPPNKQKHHVAIGSDPGDNVQHIDYWLAIRTFSDRPSFPALIHTGQADADKDRHRIAIRQWLEEHVW